ncbi:hypothetical protein [Prescottella equi]|uniref:hypothetical protein n=1 Tax=Rhodococcus hoagii TaxID=43767 RepID=UPI0007CD608E|nr:hypothetical protein [Prescottella equi]
MLDLDQGWFIPLHEQDTLAALLRDEVPDILAALAACITAEGHRTRISYDPKVTNGSDEQPLPYDNSAQDAADHLGNELATWVRHTCEHRGIDYASSWSPAGWAKWLADNIIALALTPGADEAPATIRQAVTGARRAARIPKRRTWGGSIEEAGATRLNARGIEALAREMGGDWVGLTRRRVRTLHEAELITPVNIDEGSDEQYQFLAGDVLAAHLQYPTRKRTA